MIVTRRFHIGPQSAVRRLHGVVGHFFTLPCRTCALPGSHAVATGGKGVPHDLHRTPRSRSDPLKASTEQPPYA